MDIEKCNCGAIEMEVAENEYRDGAIHHRGTHRCIPLTDVADWRDFATLKSERDSLERIVRAALTNEYWANGVGLEPGDWALLRSLITPEGGQ